MFVVTGATGKLGRLIVDRLLDRIPPNQLGISVRDPDKAADFAARGVRVRRGDFADAASLSDAFAGASQILLISSNARASGGDPLAQHANVINAARDARVQRLVYTSHMAVGDASAFPPMHDHAATEEILRQSGLKWTALRNGFYAESGIALMGDALDTGIIAAPADGKVAWTAHTDLAEAAAIVLTDLGQPQGPTPPLTGAQSLDLADFVAIASGITGQPIMRAILSDDEQRGRMAARGLPAGAVATVLGLFAASRAGEFAPASTALAELIGRAPVTIRDLLIAKWGSQRELRR